MELKNKIIFLIYILWLRTKIEVKILEHKIIDKIIKTFWQIPPGFWTSKDFRRYYEQKYNRKINLYKIKKSEKSK